MNTTENTLVCTIETRSVYGNVLAYPQDTEAETFAAIAGTLTLSASVITHILALGYTIEHRAPNGALISAFDADNAKPLLDVLTGNTIQQHNARVLNTLNTLTSSASREAKARREHEASYV